MPLDNLDQYTVVRSDNRDVERNQLNKILKRVRDALNTADGEFDGGYAGSSYSPGPGVIDGGGST